MTRSLLLIVTLLAAGCNPIYKAPVQQGNVLDQDMIDQLRPYMSKRQVELVLGTPALKSAFHGDRWDYMYTMRIGRGELQKRRFTVVFNEDQLIRLEGDWRPSQAAIVEYQNRKAEQAQEAAAEQIAAEGAAIDQTRTEEIASEQAAAKMDVPEEEATRDIEAIEAGDESDVAYEPDED